LRTDGKLTENTARIGAIALKKSSHDRLKGGGDGVQNRLGGWILKEGAMCLRE